jgi:hypothetical protein
MIICSNLSSIKNVRGTLEVLRTSENLREKIFIPFLIHKRGIHAPGKEF